MSSDTFEPKTTIEFLEDLSESLKESFFYIEPGTITMVRNNVILLSSNPKAFTKEDVPGILLGFVLTTETCDQPIFYRRSLKYRVLVKEQIRDCWGVQNFDF